MFWLKQATIR